MGNTIKFQGYLQFYIKVKRGGHCYRIMINCDSICHPGDQVIAQELQPDIEIALRILKDAGAKKINYFFLISPTISSIE